MIYIFYLFGFLAILWEFIQISRPHKMHEVAKTLKKAGKEGTVDDLPSNYKTLSFFMFGYIIWVFMGLFTAQWPIFLFLILISLIPKKYVLHRWVDSFVSLLLLLFAMINTFHLHIDLTSLIL